MEASESHGQKRPRHSAFADEMSAIKQEMAQAFATNDEAAMIKAAGKMEALKKRGELACEEEEDAIQREMAEAFLASDEGAMTVAAKKMKALKNRPDYKIDEEAESIQREMAAAFEANDTAAMIAATSKMNAFKAKKSGAFKKKVVVKSPQANPNLPAFLRKKLSAQAASTDGAPPEATVQVEQDLAELGEMQAMQMAMMGMPQQALPSTPAGSTSSAFKSKSVNAGNAESSAGMEFNGDMSSMDLLSSDATDQMKAQLAMQQAFTSAQQMQLAQQEKFQAQMRSWETKQADPSAKHTRFGNGYRPTQLCKELFLYNGCEHGSKCTFAHSYDELHPASAELIDQQNGTGNVEHKLEEWETKIPEMRMKKKREMCQKLKNKGKCLLAEKCMFAHTEADLGKVMLVYTDPTHIKTDICWKWETGKCPFGRYCSHAHGMDQIATPKPPQEILNMSKPIRPRSLTGWTGPG